ncbi:MAG: transporter substrate-binding domain-containing protein [Bacteroidales bacterium]|nr:transporter substrate-binding domain-containing protein [Bacteroidales bacterium]
MKNSFFLIIAAFFMMAPFFLLTSCDKEDDEDVTIQVYGVEFTPNILEDAGGMAGIDADITAEAMQQAGITYEMNLSESFPSAYNAALAGPNKAMMSVGYTPERKDLFKWAGPTSQSMYGIFEKGASDLVFPLPIDECKSLPSIAVVNNWLETTTLEELGFSNLVHYNTYDEALAAFMNGDIKFMASDFFHLVKKLPSGYFMEHVKTVTRFRTVYNYIAFSKDVSDAVVSKTQKAIEAMIMNQRSIAIMREYMSIMPSDYMPGTIQIYTEASPPFSYMTGQDTTRKIEGSSVDIVNEIQARTGHVNKLNMGLWLDAYAIVQYLPNSALFNMTRSSEREAMFQWVGPISTSKSYFYTLASSGLTIQTLEQAKALQSIATPKGWFTHDFLIANHFQNIVATSLTSAEAFQQLMQGEVQALLMTDLDVKWLAEINEVPLNNLTQQLQVSDLKDYIAFSLNTPTSTVQQWQQHLDAMKADETFNTIWNKWFEGAPKP